MPDTFTTIGKTGNLNLQSFNDVFKVRKVLTQPIRFCRLHCYWKEVPDETLVIRSLCCLPIC